MKSQQFSAVYFLAWTGLFRSGCWVLSRQLLLSFSWAAPRWFVYSALWSVLELTKRQISQRLSRRQYSRSRGSSRSIADSLGWRKSLLGWLLLLRLLQCFSFTILQTTSLLHSSHGRFNFTQYSVCIKKGTSGGGCQRRESLQGSGPRRIHKFAETDRYLTSRLWKQI